jgi:methionine salvage enolase-phosphatase E1
MERSNLIPITRIYDIYPKYTYSVDVKKFMDEIVDIDRANVYTEDEVIAMLTELQAEIDELPNQELQNSDWKSGFIHGLADVQEKVIQQKIEQLRRNLEIRRNTW